MITLKLRRIPGVPPYVSSKVVCVVLGIDRHTLSEWIKAGKIKRPFHIDEVNRLLKTRKAPASFR